VAAGTARRNAALLAAHSGLQYVLFPIPVITLFWKDHVGMSITDVMTLQAAFAATVVALEFPSGHLADRAGYRRSLLVGAAFWVMGWVVYARGATFAAMVGAEVLLGAGSAFMSGADRALLWVSLDADGRGREYTRWEGRLRAAAQTGEAASAAAGGWLYALAPRLPFWLQVPAAVLGLTTVAALREVRHPAAGAHQRHLARALHVLRTALWHHRRLRAAIALSVTLGMSSFVVVWLIQPYLQSRGVPPGWFGPFWAGAHLFLAGVSLASARVAAAVGVRGALLGCCLLVPLGYAGLAASASAWGALFYLAFMVLRGLQGPILATVMQADAPGEDRASVLSLAALCFRLTFLVAGPPIGALVDRAGLDTALAILAVGFTAAALGALALFRRAHSAAA
jgi:MFS family permease